MSREAFHQLLQRYLDGNCTSEEKKIVEQWYGLLDKNDLPEVPEESFNEIEQRLWDKVKPESEFVERRAEKKVVRSMWIRISVAAAVVLVTLVAGLLTRYQNEEPEFLAENALSNLGEKINHTDHRIAVLLEDGSRVVLKPKASISYPRHFSARKREVILKGEAFFDVSKNPGRPFLVFNDDVIIRVVGTSFTVKPGRGFRKTEVLVSSGKVIVTEKPTRKSFARLFNLEDKVELTPNQKATFDPSDGHLEVGLVDDPVPLISPENGSRQSVSFIFNESPISSVLDELEKVYGVKIVTRNDAMKHCTFTGDLSGQDLYSKLEFICQSIKASYEIKGVTIYIEGKGCN
ncbi:FecR family protein [Arcticibacter tournemirensis]|uniref:DUF4974 domain-containing protein n=1 Tax=Arcticibacter tournemirensis TaxID=699437 RepID=A0A5M9H8X7_9SPHI|nr:FecR family protein [Arcticibacter tournemirensis]KAA8481557.1 DUF4974 domain-containing protein [Arcticibacter tournemirensis]TQM49055.1 FecR family protein [Arcticibacter tournemirensis]